MFFFFVLLLPFLFPTPVFADDFSTSLVSTYTVFPTAQTSVQHIFSLKNTSSLFYISNYAFQIGGTDIQNLVIKSNDQIMNPTVTKQRSTTTITVQFPDKIIGKDKERKLSVTYQTTQTARKIGTIIEVSVPRISDTSSLTAYTARIIVPKDFPAPSRTSPEKFQTTQDSDKTTLTFDLQSKPSAINLTFGSVQHSKLGLTYSISNQTTTKVQTAITLPTDGVYQTVAIENIDPQPTSIQTDDDGNWLAYYDLRAGEDKKVHVDAFVTTQADPAPHANNYTKAPPDAATKAREFWESKNSDIVKIARTLHTPEDVYRKTLQLLSYDFTRKNAPSARVGAAEILKNPTGALCEDFSDLFIALARSSNIPAREVIGYAYSQDQQFRPIGIGVDTLHAWPEYFDRSRGLWIGVDPTWEDTTAGLDYFHSIDFHRIALTLRASSSTFPLPAQEVSVEFVDSIPQIPPTYSSKIALHPRSLFGLSDTYALTVKNTTYLARYNVPIMISSENSAGTTESSQTTTFLPGEEKEFPIRLPKKGPFAFGKTIVTIHIGSSITTHELTTSSTIKQLLPTVLIAGLVAISIGICATIARRLLVPRWK